MWGLFLDTSHRNLRQYQQRMPDALQDFGATAKPHLPKLGCYLRKERYIMWCTILLPDPEPPERQVLVAINKL